MYTAGFSAMRPVMFLLLLIASTQTQAQVDQETQDTITGSVVGQIAIGNPSSILEAYTYDPVTDRYIYTNTVDGFNINYPIILTPKEYQELVQRESMRAYFKQKSDAIDGKKDGSDAAQRLDTM